MRPAIALALLVSLAMLSAAQAQQALDYDEARALARSGQMVLDQRRSDEDLIKATDMLSTAADALQAAGAAFEAVQTRLRLLQAASPGVRPAILQAIMPVADRLVDEVRRLSDPSLLGQSLLARAHLATWLGKPETAAPDALAALDEAAKLPSPTLIGAATVVLCQAAAGGVNVPGLSDRIAAAINALSERDAATPDGTAVEVLRQLAYHADRIGLADACARAAMGAVRGAARLRDMPWMIIGTFTEMGDLASRRLPDGAKGAYFATALQALAKIDDARVHAGATAAYARTAPADAALAQLVTDALAALPADVGADTRVGLIRGLVRAKVGLGLRDELGPLFDEAAKVVEAAQNPEERAGLASQVASMAFESGLADRAVTVLKENLAALPADAGPARVRCALDIAQYRLAIAQQEAQAAQARGEDPQELLGRAREDALAELEQEAGGLLLLTLATPQEAFVALSAADMFVALDEPLKAVALGSRVLKMAEDMGIREMQFAAGWTLARAHHAVGSDDAASDAAERALAAGLGEQNPWTQRVLAGILENGGKAEQALKLYDAAIARLRETDPTSQLLPTLLFQRAWCLIGMGRSTEAVADIDALETPEEYLKLRGALLKAWVVAQAGDAAAVRAVLGPDRGDVLAQQWFLDSMFDGPTRTGGELRRQERFLEAAVAALTVAGDRAAGVACGYLALAETQNRLREFQAALDSATKAAEVIGPEGGGALYPRVLRAQANAYEGLGDAARAAELRAQADAVQKEQ